MKIWIVQGTTGEYSDRSEWLVVAYRTEEAANAKAVELKRALQESGIERMTRWEEPWEKAVAEFKAAHDPNFKNDYTGTDWYVESCELLHEE